MQIGIDLGATKIEYVLLNDKGDEIIRDREKTPLDYSETIDTISNIVNKLDTKYNNKFNVIPKNAIKYFDKKILKLNNLNIADLDHNELEFLQLKGLLDEKLIKPLYLS